MSKAVPKTEKRGAERKPAVKSALPAFTAIDFETSGYEPHKACSVALVRVVGGRVVEEFHTLIRPPDKWVLFTELHGLTWNRLKNERDFPEAAYAKIVEMAKASEFLVAHNASFDRRVLEHTCQFHGLAAPGLPWRCTCKSSRKHFGKRFPDHKLPTVCREMGVELKSHHDAMADARACAEVALRLLAHNALTGS